MVKDDMMVSGTKVRSDTKKGVMESMKKVVGPGIVVPNDSKDNEVAYMMGHCSLEETLEKDFSVAMGRREEGSRSLRNITSLGIYTDLLPEMLSILPSMQRVLTLGEQ